MTRLTPMEITIRHGICDLPGCLICGGENFADILAGVKNVGLTVDGFSSGSECAFPFIAVKEDETTCSQKLNPGLFCLTGKNFFRHAQ